MGGVTEPSSASTSGVIPSYTHAVKTAVSIPDDVFAAADRLARRRKMTRSGLYADALRRLLAESDLDGDVTARLDAVYADAGGDLDPALVAAQNHAIAERW